jgi:hypothetical protein
MPPKSKAKSKAKAAVPVDYVLQQLREEKQNLKA